MMAKTLQFMPEKYNKRNETTSVGTGGIMYSVCNASHGFYSCSKLHNLCQTST